MVDLNALKERIDNTGISMTLLSERSGISRVTLYNRLNGIGVFTAIEIVNLSKALHLSKKERDAIFLLEKVN